ncbi:ABC-type multidrug transport system fused ATPase/permease subunit [Neomicrococcus aestuarii]|uniref:ABC-type multidrug transport system fused ATPase/permease subunit n=1 Tax=Neomicrococcus aestuarii TaxID=556325 RepID=A0A7W8TRN7_9MICC|nr:hypothetical protein [Neomicrococcus aestuarii]MBB5511529.1 ABC-type multidrug transport system fused ATPase/permease subunit [Neomicrococcus aestuarii]
MASPGDVAMILTLTGTYPAVTWAAYVCLGIAIGRLSLHRERTQVAVMITGLVVAVLSKIATYILLIRQDGLQQIMNATEGLTREELRSYQIFGAESYFPTTTYWWLALDAPHTNTAFSIAFGAGLAMFVLGLVLILSKYIMSWLGVFAAMGTMTLTLYSAHLVFVNLINVRENYVIYFIAQIVVAAVFAMAWAKIRGTGPLEFLVSKSSKAVGAAFVPERKDRSTRA